MKRFLAGVLAAAFIFAGCGSQTQDEEKTILPVSEIFAEIETEVGVTEYNVLKDSYLTNYYGVDMEIVEEFYAIAPKNLSDVDTVLLFKANSTSDAASIAEVLEAVRTQKLDEMRDYMPEQYKIMEKSSVVIDGEYTYLVISENASEIEEIIEKHIP